MRTNSSTCPNLPIDDLRIKNEVNVQYVEIKDKQISQYIEGFLDVIQVHLTPVAPNNNLPNRNSSNVNKHISRKSKSSKESKPPINKSP